MSKFHHFRDLEVASNAASDLQQLKELAIDDLTVLFQLYYSLEFAIGQVFADGDDRYYPNASFSVLKFMAKLRLIQRICGVGSRFLDVGCGLGNKVWLAQTIGFDAHGIEINQKYADIAGECVGTNRIFCHDGITFPDYDQYDVIYFYNPMPSDELETAIITNAKKDAIIYHAIELRSPPNRASVRLSPRVMRLTDEGTRRCQTSRRRLSPTEPALPFRESAPATSARPCGQTDVARPGPHEDLPTSFSFAQATRFRGFSD